MDIYNLQFWKKFQHFLAKRLVSEGAATIQSNMLHYAHRQVFLGMLFVYVGVCHRSPKLLHAASESTWITNLSSGMYFPATEEFGPLCQVASSDHTDLSTSKQIWTYAHQWQIQIVLLLKPITKNCFSHHDALNSFAPNTLNINK